VRGSAWDSNGGASWRWSAAVALLTLVVAIDNLANKSFGIGFVGRGFDIVERVRGLDEHRITDNDLGVCPAGW
jgi:hypothetical protein